MIDNLSDKIIASEKEYFSGREWVFRNIDNWLYSKKKERHFLLTGEPGSGKSAIARRLKAFSEGVIQPPASCGYLGSGFLAASHFCMARNPLSIDGREFAKAISTQLAHLDGYIQALIDVGNAQSSIDVNVIIEQVKKGGEVTIFKDLNLAGLTAQRSFNQLVLRPLQQLFPKGSKQPVIIMVDALDEAYLKGGDSIVDLLADLKGLPLNVRFILTSRHDNRVEKRYTGAVKFSLSDSRFSDMYQKDLQNYVYKRVENDQILISRLHWKTTAESSSWANKVAYHADGNFQYVYFLLREIAEGLRSPEELEGLPRGLDLLYYQSLDRIIRRGQKDWARDYQPVLGVLCVAGQALDLDQLRRFTGQDKTDLWNNLRDLYQFIEQLISSEIGPTESEKDLAYRRLYHQSFIDFLRKMYIGSGEERQENDYYTPAEKWHGQIGDAYWKKPASWKSVRWEDVDDYGLQFLATHLYHAGDPKTGWQDLYDLLSSGYLREKEQRLLPRETHHVPGFLWSGGLQSTLVEVERALNAAYRQRNTLMVIRMLLLMARLNRVLEGMAYFGMIGLEARRGYYQIALHKAEMISDSDLRFSQLLLVAEIALRAGEKAVGLNALDKALRIGGRDFRIHSGALASFAIFLLAEHTAIDRTQKLAEMTKSKFDDWLRAAAHSLLLVDLDKANALLDEIVDGYNWYHALLDLIEATIDDQPTVALLLLKRRNKRAIQTDDFVRILDSLAFMRRLDPLKAKELNRYVIDAVRQKANELGTSLKNNRGLAQLFNQAIEELVHDDLIEALDLAMHECPEIIDSPHTRPITLARILSTARMQEIYLGLPRLRQIFFELQPVKPAISPNEIDAFWYRLAIQFAFEGSIEDARSCYKKIQNSHWCLLVDLQLPSLNPEIEPEQEVFSNMTLEVLSNSWMHRDIRAIIEYLVTSPDLQEMILQGMDDQKALFHLLLKLMEASEQECPNLVNMCIPLLELPIESSKEYKDWLDFISQSYRHHPDLVKKQLEILVHSLLDKDRLETRQTEQLVELLINHSHLDLAQLLAKHWAKMLVLGDERQNGRRLADLAVQVVNNGLIFPPVTWRKVLEAIDNPYLTGWLTARLPEETFEISERLRLPINLTGGVFGQLLNQSSYLPSLVAIDRLAALATNPISRIFIQIQRTAIATENDPKLLKRRLLEILAKLDDEAYVEKKSDLQQVIIYALAVSNHVEAIKQANEYDPWERHLIFIYISWMSQNNQDVAKAKEALLAAYTAAREINELDNKIIALLNVGVNAKKQDYDISKVCIQEALDLLSKLPDPEGKAVVALIILSKAEVLTQDQINIVKDNLTKLKLNEDVRWSRDEIFEVAKDVKDSEIAAWVWSTVGSGIISTSKYYYLHTDDLSIVCAHLARLGDEKNSKVLLRRISSHIDLELKAPNVPAIVCLFCARDYLGEVNLKKYVLAFIDKLRRKCHKPENTAGLPSKEFDIADDFQSYAAVGIERFAEYSSPESLLGIWKKLLELVKELDNEKKRSEALYWMVEAATKPDAHASLGLVSAVPLLSSIPHQKVRDAAIDHIIAIMETETMLPDDGVESLWPQIFAAVRGSVPASMRCAEAWCKVAIQAENNEATLLSLIEQLEFVKNII